MQDCPDGQYHTLEKTGKKQRSKPWRELYNGFTNYRMWGLAACYAYSFGVEVCFALASHLTSPSKLSWLSHAATYYATFDQSWASLECIILRPLPNVRLRVLSTCKCYVDSVWP